VIDVFTEFSIKLEVILARASIRILHNKPDKCLNVKIIVFFFPRTICHNSDIFRSVERIGLIRRLCYV